MYVLNITIWNCTNDTTISRIANFDGHGVYLGRMGVDFLLIWRAEGRVIFFCFPLSAFFICRLLFA
jgi:hypothetical protein